MSLRPEDIALIKQLEDALVGELDRQGMDYEIEDGSTDSGAYFDPVSGEVAGIPDWFKVATVVAQALWDEEGR